MISHGFVNRLTKDVDLFTEVDDEEAIRVAAALRPALQGLGLHTRNTTRPPHDHRFVVIDPSTGQECTVEVFADGGRLHQRVRLDIGAVLHPEDLAADKMLALWSRARPRDYYDVHSLINQFGTKRLLDLTVAKDAGFTSTTFLDVLNAIDRLTPEDWTEDGIPESGVTRLRTTFANWHQQLSSATQE